MHYTVLIFVARWRHNFREIAVKISESPKIREVFSSYREFWRKFQRSSLRPRM